MIEACFFFVLHSFACAYKNKGLNTKDFFSCYASVNHMRSRGDLLKLQVLATITILKCCILYTMSKISY